MLFWTGLRVDQYIETDNRIIQKYEPGYMKPFQNMDGHISMHLINR